MSGLPARTQGLAALLAVGGVLASAAVIVHGPAFVRQTRVQLPGFTAEEVSGQLVVTSVRDDSGAERAGIASGDVLVSLDGRPMRRMQEATQFLNHHRHDPVRVGLVHLARRTDVVIGKRER
jgi:S1-C subfamily serine protease